jgi:hypothetical protein
MVEIKIAIVKLLQAFHLQADETTRYVVKRCSGSGTVLKFAGGGGGLGRVRGLQEMSYILADQ